MNHKTKLFLSVFVLAGSVFLSPLSYAESLPQQTLIELERKADYIFVEELDDRVVVFQSVFRPDIHNKNYRALISQEDLSGARNVLEIGTGSGVNALLAFKAGAGHVTVTDINDSAVANSRYNAEKLGYGERLDARLVPMDDAGAFSVIKQNEKFDLILFNPPWFNRKPNTIAEYALYDEHYRLHESFMRGLAAHLTPEGKAWVELGHNEALKLLKKEAAAADLNMKILKQERVGRVNYTIVELRLKNNI